MRAALYWTPELDDGLFAAGNVWLGRDPETGAALAQPDVAGIAEATAAPRLYGFHATLRPPMRLADEWDAFMRTAREIAAGIAAFDLPPLSAGLIDGYLALQESAPCPALQALADACVIRSDPHRAPAGQAELTRRRAAGLTPTQEAYLLRWGYPYVLSTWRFHMTLSGKLAESEQPRLFAAASAHFAGVAGARRRVESLSVFTQAEAGEPFLLAERLPLG